MVDPRITYLICSTPRSGTTLLCEALRNSALAGRPEEYFQHLLETGRPRTAADYFADSDDLEVLELVGNCAEPDEEDQYEPSRFPEWRAYFEWALGHGTTPNGVFGAKIMWAYLDGLVARLGRLPCCAAAGDDAEVLERALPGLEYVFVTRRDKVRQAVSLWRALQTWSWRSCPEPGEVAEWLRLQYSFEAIDRLCLLLSEEEAAWRDWFESHGIEPFRVVYEDFADAYEDTALAILQRIGVRVPVGLRFGERRLRRQADGLSEEWVQRYAAETFARVG